MNFEYPLVNPCEFKFLDATALLEAQEQAQQAIQEHTENNLTDPTVGDVIGGRRTIIKEYSTLPSGLPYNKFNQGSTFGVVPSNLQNKAAVGFNGERTVFPFAQVNSQKVTLQFTPATQADEDALAALLPEGEITDVSQLPSNIPSYLVTVIPELSLNGEVFRQGSPMRLGDEINLNYQFSGPLTTYAPYNYSVIAGSYLNVPLVAQSVSPTFLESLQTRVEQTRTILESGDQSQIAGLTREEILGDLFYAGGLGYFAQNIGLSHIAALQSNGSLKLEYGYGSFGYEPNLNTFFGITRGIQTGGVGVNMLFAVAAESQNGDTQARNQLRFQAGLISSTLEHAVPEQMFSDPENPTLGFSAVRALELAAQEGQRIFQISSENLNEVMPQLNLDISVEDEIRDSVNAGRIVVTHSDNVSVPGFSGAGYLILDPDTLIGSYKISGGSNGGAFDIGSEIGATLGFGVLTAGLGLLIGGNPVVLAAGLALLTAALIQLAVALFVVSFLNHSTQWCLVSGFVYGLQVALFAGGLTVAATNPIITAVIAAIEGAFLIASSEAVDFSTRDQCVEGM